MDRGRNGRWLSSLFASQIMDFVFSLQIEEIADLYCFICQTIGLEWTDWQTCGTAPSSHLWPSPLHWSWWELPPFCLILIVQSDCALMHKCLFAVLSFAHVVFCCFKGIYRGFYACFVWCVVGVVLINGMPHGLYPMCLWTEYTSSFIFECMQNHTQGDGWASPQRPGSFPATEWVTFCMYQEWRCVWCVFLSSDGCCPTFCMNQEWRCVWCIFLSSNGCCPTFCMYQEWRCVWCVFLSSDSYCPRHVCCINHAHSWGLHAQAASVPQTGALLRIALHEKCALWLFTSWLW